MAITSADSGSQTCTANGTEYFLSSASPQVEYTTDGTYVLTLDLSDLANGEEVTVKAYNKVKSDGTTRLLYSQPVANAQTLQVLHLDPIPCMNACKFSLTQTVGSGAVVVWEVIRL